MPFHGAALHPTELMPGSRLEACAWEVGSGRGSDWTSNSMAKYISSAHPPPPPLRTASDTPTFVELLQGVVEQHDVVEALSRDMPPPLHPSRPATRMQQHRRASRASSSFSRHDVLARANRLVRRWRAAG